MLKYTYLGLLLICTLQFCPALTQSNQQDRTGEPRPERLPIILVPGIAGCRAYAARRNSTATKPELIWLSYTALFWFKDLFDKFSLLYDSKKHVSLDRSEWEIQFPGWGDTKNLELLDGDSGLAKVMYMLVKHLKRTDPFYQSGKSIRGAPYDFRRAPNENREFLTKMKTLVEETYKLNNGKRVVFVSHSMGSLYTNWFLSEQTEQWKKKYIHAYVAVGAPFGGAMRAIKSLITGENFGLFYVSVLKIRELERSMPSLGFLTPDTRLWPSNEVVVATPEKNYSMHDMKELFDDIAFPDGYDMMTHTKGGRYLLEAPTGVDNLYCAYGTGLLTPEKLLYRPAKFYRKPFPDQVPEVIYGDGDGIVNSRSLRVCQGWKDVHLHELPNLSHIGILWSDRLHKIIDKASTIDYSTHVDARSNNNEALG